MTKLEKLLIENIKKTIADISLIDYNEQCLLGLSGGKDSMALYDLLKSLNVNFIPVHINHNWEKSYQFDNLLPKDTIVVNSDIANLLLNKNIKNNYCFVCSRERRKLLLTWAKENNINKIILGHNKNDVAETLLLNIFYSREISTLMPKQPLFDNQFTIIRPLYEIEEYLISKFIIEKKITVIKNSCPYAEKSKRKVVRDLLNDLKKTQTNNRHFDLTDNIYSSLKNVNSKFIPFKIK